VWELMKKPHMRYEGGEKVHSVKGGAVRSLHHFLAALLATADE